MIPKHLNTVRSRNLILILIALAAAVPRLWLGASQYIEYDGYWHVFIAQQDKWPRFWADVYANDNPPLFYLLLKFVMLFGRNSLIYRSISITADAASVFLVGWISWKVTHSNARSWQAALAYGLALPAIIMASEVRSYMLSVVFVLISFGCLLEIADPEKSKIETRWRMGFAVCAILACLSHYFAFYYAGAAILLLGVRAVYERSHWKAEMATCAPVIACVAALYFVHVRSQAGIQKGHLLAYYFNPAGSETAVTFLLRNWKNLINLFLPFAVPTNVIAAGVLVASLACVLWLGGLRQQRKSAWTIRITALMLAGFALSALAGKYPFGGELRQQYLLFPFLVICAAIVVERLAGPLGIFVPRNARVVLNGLVAVAIVWVSAVQFERYPKFSGNIGADRMAEFEALAPRPRAVFLDQFNLILFFIFHHTWQWRSVEPKPPLEGIDVYRLTRGPDEMLVFRDMVDWNIDPNDSAVYPKLAQSLRFQQTPAELSVLGVRQSPPQPAFTDVRQTRRRIIENATDSGICVERLAINRVVWYATFLSSNCTASSVRPPRMNGTFKSESEEIDYTGNWSHAAFAQAASGTETFSDSPGAILRLEFEGTRITWVYAKAYNRGIAEVTLDGIAHGEVDLYSPRITWQARTTFGGLKPGKHVLQIAVSGRKDAAASDRYVDVDELIADR